MCLPLCQATLYRLLEVYNTSWNQVAGVLQPCSLPWLLWISRCFTFHLHFRKSLSICLKIIKIFDWHYIEPVLCSFWVYCHKYRSCQLITESCWLWTYLDSPIVVLVLLNIFWNSVNIWLHIRIFFNWPFYIYFLNVLLCDWPYSFSDFHFA